MPEGEEQEILRGQFGALKQQRSRGICLRGHCVKYSGQECRLHGGRHCQPMEERRMRRTTGMPRPYTGGRPYQRDVTPASNKGLCPPIKAPRGTRGALSGGATPAGEPSGDASGPPVPPAAAAPPSGFLLPPWGSCPLLFCPFAPYLPRLLAALASFVPRSPGFLASCPSVPPCPFFPVPAG